MEEPELFMTVIPSTTTSSCCVVTNLSSHKSLSTLNIIKLSCRYHQPSWRPDSLFTTGVVNCYNVSAVTDLAWPILVLTCRYRLQTGPGGHSMVDIYTIILPNYETKTWSQSCSAPTVPTHANNFFLIFQASPIHLVQGVDNFICKHKHINSFQ